MIVTAQARPRNGDAHDAFDFVEAKDMRLEIRMELLAISEELQEYIYDGIL